MAYTSKEIHPGDRSSGYSTKDANDLDTVLSDLDTAVAAVGALPPLGFIHEESSNAFTLDIADLFRSELTLPMAFSVARKVMNTPNLNLERELRFEAAHQFRKLKLIHRMIERIKVYLNVDDSNGDTKRL